MWIQFADPHCGKNHRIEKVAPGKTERDLGLHLSTEGRVAHLRQTIPSVTRDLRDVTAAYQGYFCKRPNEIDVLACSNGRNA